jgi:hypothetical protein
MVSLLYVGLLQFLRCRKQWVPVTDCSRLLLSSVGQSLRYGRTIGNTINVVVVIIIIIIVM